MIELKNVKKSFDGRAVLSGLNLSVGKGERVCLMGQSGGGKTTVLNLILGLLSPEEGKVHLSVPAAAVFQEDRLCENFSSLANVRLVTKDGDPERIEKLLCSLGLCEDLRRPVCELSGGMKRRVAIARALAAEREVLLLDEPFKGLDEETRKTTAAVINAHTEGKTVLLISHDEEEAALLGATVRRLQDGAVL